MFHSIVSEEQRAAFARSPLAIIGAQVYHKLGGRFAICNYLSGTGTGLANTSNHEVVYSTESGAAVLVLYCWWDNAKPGYQYVLSVPRHPISAAFTSLLAMDEHASSNNPAYIVKSIDRAATRKRSPLMVTINEKVTGAWGRHVKDGLVAASKRLRDIYHEKRGDKTLDLSYPQQEALLSLVFGGKGLTDLPAIDADRLRKNWEDRQTASSASNYADDAAAKTLAGEKWVISYVPRSRESGRGRGYYIVGAIDLSTHKSSFAACIKSGYMVAGDGPLSFTIQPRMYAQLEDVPQYDDLMGSLVMAKQFLTRSQVTVNREEVSFFADGVIPSNHSAIDPDTGIILGNNNTRHIYMVPK